MVFTLFWSFLKWIKRDKKGCRTVDEDVSSYTFCFIPVVCDRVSFIPVLYEEEMRNLLVHVKGFFEMEKLEGSAICPFNIMERMETATGIDKTASTKQLITFPIKIGKMPSDM